MTDSKILSAKTWSRSVDPIIKSGYMDGAAAGQAAVFQSSFDVGYEQGIEFGFLLGIKDSRHSPQGSAHQESNSNLQDPRKINCQICLHTTTSQENIVNLFNTQKEKNDVLQ